MNSLVKWHTCRLPLLAALLLFCDNPFFPATGDPPVTSSQRSTPEGVLRQLMTAYKDQRIDLYMDLFSSAHDFKFYVAHVFAFSDPKGQALFAGKTCELIDSMCLYVKNNINDTCFYYWNYDEEIQRTEILFQKSSGIDYVGSPTYADSIRYIVNGNNETTNVEVVMRGGTIYYFTLPEPCDTANPYQLCVDEWPIDIYEQVFYLERDPESPNLWVIQKWFDLGTATGN